VRNRDVIFGCQPVSGSRHCGFSPWPVMIKRGRFVASEGFGMFFLARRSRLKVGNSDEGSGGQQKDQYNLPTGLLRRPAPCRLALCGTALGWWSYCCLHIGRSHHTAFSLQHVQSGSPPSGGTKRTCKFRNPNFAQTTYTVMSSMYRRQMQMADT